MQGNYTRQGDQLSGLQVLDKPNYDRRFIELTHVIRYVLEDLVVRGRWDNGTMIKNTFDAKKCQIAAVCARNGGF